jgi:hypothetical protein
MSVGSHHGDNDAPAPVVVVVKLLQKNPGLRAHLARRPIINRQYRVPYLAGSAIDGAITYIDNQTPDIFSKSRVYPDETYPWHERPEWWLGIMLGLPYFPATGYGAHRLAHGIEQYLMKLDGIDDERIAQYEKESLALVNIDEHVKLPPEAFPPDLWLEPYIAADDADRAEGRLDQRLLPLLRQAQFVKRTAA